MTTLDARFKLDERRKAGSGHTYIVDFIEDNVLRLVKFSVSNFRSIKKAHDIRLSQSTILIGRNNEGKSNVVKALNIAMNTLKYHASEELAKARLKGSLSRSFIRTRRRREENIYYWKRDFPISLQERKQYDESLFKLEFELNPQEVEEFKEQFKSNLNGTLPLEIRIGRSHIPQITVIKQGRGSKTLTSKSAKIAAFIGERINFTYIPAVRTDEEAFSVVQGMISEELSSLEKNLEYQEALNKLKNLQKPILEKISKSISEPLTNFLPQIKSVKVFIPEGATRVALRDECEILVDDGTETSLASKGDGVKSLAALCLLKEKEKFVGASIIAMEEPESHLHPGAIHQLRNIIYELAEENQIILTTHCPLFVDRYNVSSNILIEQSSAKSAKSINDIRLILGVKASDNLSNADLILVVEGEEDKLALGGLLPFMNEKIKSAIKNSSMVIEPIGGAGNLSYKLSLLNNALCKTHVLLDNDNAAKLAFEGAESDGVTNLLNTTFLNCIGMPESELEDCIEVSLYREKVYQEYGVKLEGNKFRNNKKWSIRMKETFLDQGKIWNQSVESKIKYLIASLVASSPEIALLEAKSSSIKALVSALENKLLPSN